MGRARDTFERHWEAAGLSEGPPRGGLASYAEEGVLAQLPRLLAACGDDAEERRHALRECESAARGLLAWCEQEAAAPRRAKSGPSRATKTPPTPAATRLADRAAARRAAMRGRR
jgi:hypothetical protein